MQSPKLSQGSDCAILPMARIRLWNTDSLKAKVNPPPEEQDIARRA